MAAWLLSRVNANWLLGYCGYFDQSFPSNIYKYIFDGYVEKCKFSGKSNSCNNEFYFGGSNRITGNVGAHVKHIFICRTAANRQSNQNRKRIIYIVMPIIINLDVMMAKRKMSLNELSQKVGLTTVNLSILKTGKAKGVRFDTLEAICKVLDCKPGDILDLE